MSHSKFVERVAFNYTGDPENNELRNMVYLHEAGYTRLGAARTDAKDICGLVIGNANHYIDPDEEDPSAAQLNTEFYEGCEPHLLIYFNTPEIAENYADAFLTIAKMMRREQRQKEKERENNDLHSEEAESGEYREGSAELPLSGHEVRSGMGE